MVSEAIAKGDVAALNYFIADKYIKAFGQLANSPNQKIIMLPIEATSILGSLAGIGEIAKATFGESAASAAAAARRGASVPSAGSAPPPATPQRDQRFPSPPRKGEGAHRRRCVVEFDFKTLEVVSWPICLLPWAPGTG